MSVVHATSCHAGHGHHHRPSSMREAVGDFNQLFRSLQAGKVSSAQEAYAALNQLAGGSASSGAPANEILADWVALGKALETGDAAAAKSAFAELKEDLEAAIKARAAGDGDAVQHAHSVYSAMQAVEGGGGAQGHHGGHHHGHHHSHHGDHHGGHHGHGLVALAPVQFVPVVPVAYVATPVQYAPVRYA